MSHEPTHATPVPDCDLIARVCQGEKHLFQELIRPYERMMYMTAYAVLRNPADSEEAVQEGALKAYLHLDQLQQTSSFRPWLLQIVLNEARMYRRRMRRDLYESIDEAHINDEGNNAPRQFADWRELPDEALEREELRQAVLQAVNQLSPSYREVYVLFDVQHLSAAAIAEILGITVGLVKVRLHRARLKIQQQIGPVFQPKWSDHLRLLKGMRPWSDVRK